MKLSALVGGHVEMIGSYATLREAARRMVEKGIGSLLVTGESGIAGIITEHDLALAAAHDADFDLGASGDWMSDYPLLADPEWEIEQAIDVMLEHGFRHLPVVDDKDPVGMVSMKDLIWAVRGDLSDSG